ncbi:MAG: hypothetical protein M0T81_08090 [Thermoplasmatales archaeon]|nr:hypothetical protein [Thermoplasmatales archaeon]
MRTLEFGRLIPSGREVAFKILLFLAGTTIPGASEIVNFVEQVYNKKIGRFVKMKLKIANS